MPDISDLSMRAVEVALDGLERRSDVRAQNMANVNTPGYAARSVDFESALADAVRRGELTGATVPGSSLEPVMSIQNGQGNTVDLEGEMTGMLKDNLTRSALINHFNVKVTMLRAAITR